MADDSSLVCFVCEKEATLLLQVCGDENFGERICQTCLLQDESLSLLASSFQAKSVCPFCEDNTLNPKLNCSNPKSYIEQYFKSEGKDLVRDVSPLPISAKAKRTENIKRRIVLRAPMIAPGQNSIFRTVEEALSSSPKGRPTVVQRYGVTGNATQNQQNQPLPKTNRYFSALTNANRLTQSIDTRVTSAGTVGTSLTATRATKIRSMSSALGETTDALNKKMQSGTRDESYAQNSIHLSETASRRKSSFDIASVRPQNENAGFEQSALNKRKPMHLKQLCTVIADLYEKKIIFDDMDDRRSKLEFPDFVVESFVTQYGLRRIAEENLHALISGVRRHHRSSPRVALFGVLLGILEPEDYTPLSSEVVMTFLSGLLPKNEIKERMEDGEKHSWVPFNNVIKVLNSMFRYNPYWNFSQFSGIMEQYSGELASPWSDDMREELADVLESLCETVKDEHLRGRLPSYLDNASLVVPLDMTLAHITRYWLDEYCRILRELGGLEGVLLKARQEEIERMQLEAENQRNRPFSVEEIQRLVVGLSAFGVDADSVDKDSPIWKTIYQNYDFKHRTPDVLYERWRQLKQEEQEYEALKWNWQSWNWNQDWEWGGLVVVPDDTPGEDVLRVDNSDIEESSKHLFESIAEFKTKNWKKAISGVGNIVASREEACLRPRRRSSIGIDFVNVTIPEEEYDESNSGYNTPDMSSFYSNFIKKESKQVETHEKYQSGKNMTSSTSTSALDNHTLNRDVTMAINQLNQLSNSKSTPMLPQTFQGRQDEGKSPELDDSDGDDEFDTNASHVSISSIMQKKWVVPMSGVKLIGCLDLSHYYLGEDGAVALANGLCETNVPYLEQVILKGNGLRDGGVAKIIQGLMNGKVNMSTLRLIDLSDNTIGCRGIRLLSDFLSHRNCKLEALNLSGNKLRDSDLQHLDRGLQVNISLQSLDLSRNRLQKITRFCHSITFCCSLGFVDLSWNNLRHEAICSLAAALTGLSLSTVNSFVDPFSTHLSEDKKLNSTKTNSTKSVSHSPASSSPSPVTPMDFPHDNIHDFHLNGSSQHTRSSQSKPVIEFSDVKETSFPSRSRNTLGSVQFNESMKRTQSMHVGSQFQKLQKRATDSRSVVIGVKNCQASVSTGTLVSKQQTGTVQHLDLSFNKIGDKGALAVSLILRHNRTLRELNVAFNGITERAGEEIANSLSLNSAHQLQWLNLKGNYISSATISIILSGTKLGVFGNLVDGLALEYSLPLEWKDPPSYSLATPFSTSHIGSPYRHSPEPRFSFDLQRTFDSPSHKQSNLTPKTHKIAISKLGFS